ncbi:MAG: hypothetical protein FJ295_12850 [Planctomycetes bacterium]|nr:hypothetical protein [Planctomycetota bacterium]
MSLGSLGSIAATSLSQATVADADRIRHAAANRSRETAAQRATDLAGGIAPTKQEQETQDRDADGRQLWARQQPGDSEHPASDELPKPIAPKVPSGDRGSLLDLHG